MAVINVVAVLEVILLLAVMLERLVEAIFAPMFDHIQFLTPFKWAQFYIAIILGILGALLYKFDLIFLLSSQLGAGLPQTYYGYVITGAAIGSGSALIHDLITKFFPGAGSLGNNISPNETDGRPMAGPAIRG